jgi:hypothetical protein
MQKISHLVFLIVLVALVATSCMARSMANQAEFGDVLNDSVNKRGISASLAVYPVII